MMQRHQNISLAARFFRARPLLKALFLGACACALVVLLVDVYAQQAAKNSPAELILALAFGISVQFAVNTLVVSSDRLFGKPEAERRDCVVASA